MKNVTCSVAVLLLIVLLSPLSAAGTKESAASDPLSAVKAKGYLSVGCKVDVPSFGYKNINTGEIEGFEIDLAKAVAKRIFGDENAIRLTPVTAKTRGPLLDTGELDMVAATFTVTEERRKSWDFSTIYYVDAVAVMVEIITLCRLLRPCRKNHRGGAECYHQEEPGSRGRRSGNYAQVQ